MTELRKRGVCAPVCSGLRKGGRRPCDMLRQDEDTLSEVTQSERIILCDPLIQGVAYDQTCPSRKNGDCQGLGGRR